MPSKHAEAVKAQIKANQDKRTAMLKSVGIATKKKPKQKPAESAQSPLEAQSNAESEASGPSQSPAPSLLNLPSNIQFNAQSEALDPSQLQALSQEDLWPSKDLLQFERQQQLVQYEVDLEWALPFQSRGSYAWDYCADVPVHHLFDRLKSAQTCWDETSVYWLCRLRDNLLSFEQISLSLEFQVTPEECRKQYKRCVQDNYVSKKHPFHWLWAEHERLLYRMVDKEQGSWNRISWCWSFRRGSDCSVEWFLLAHKTSISPLENGQVLTAYTALENALPEERQWSSPPRSFQAEQLMKEEIERKQIVRPKEQIPSNYTVWRG